MTEEKKQKILLFILAFLIISVVCGGVFAYFDIKTKKEILALNEKIIFLQNQKKTIEEQKGVLENQLQDLKEGVNSESQSIACKQTLSSSDNEMIKNWKEISNLKHRFSFKYPRTWTVISNKENLIEIKGDEADINFKFASEMPSVDIEESYKKQEEKTIEVFCQGAKETIYSGEDNHNLITVLFKVDKVSYAIILGYKDIGASVSSDILDAFDLILKTVNFD